jgi:hypothetical protein
MKDRFQGMIQTVWSGVDEFLAERDAAKKAKAMPTTGQWASFDSLFKRIDELAARN